MRYLPLAVLTSLALLVAACDGSDDDGSPDAAGGTAGEASTGDAGSGAGPSRGGSVGSSPVDFTDLPGKIRFINFVSDGTSGVNLDLYWGISVGRGEKVATIEYREVTEFLTPRHADEPVLAANEARFFLVKEGDVSSTPASFLVQNDPEFTADTVLTLALAAADGVGALADTLTVAAQTIDEAALTTPPAGMAHVYGWSEPFSQIEAGNFVLVGAEDLCGPERGDPGLANIGEPALIPDGATGLTLFDANTEPPCDSGATPITESVEAGHSYMLLGEAETYERDARRTVLLELGTAD